MLAGHEAMLIQPTALPQERPRALVQLGHVRAPVGEHHDLTQAALARSRPPIDQHPLLRVGRVVGHEKATLAGRVPEVALGVALAQLRQRVALGRLQLAAVLHEPHRAELIAEGGVEPTRPDGGKLCRVSDQALAKLIRGPAARRLGAADPMAEGGRDEALAVLADGPARPRPRRTMQASDSR